MPLNPSFGQYEFDCQTENETATRLREDIRKTWSARTREDIQSVSTASEWDGNVLKVTLEDDKTPPTIGSFIHGLLRYGWALLYADNTSLYFSEIQESFETYYLSGRQQSEPEVKPIRRVPEIKLNLEMPLDNRGSLRDKRRLQSLNQDLLEIWPTKTLEKIEQLKCSTSDDNNYIIRTTSDTVFEPYERALNSKPDTPLGKHIDALLSRGWVVATIKTNDLFVGRLKDVKAEDAGENYKLEHNSHLTYVPKVCEFCEQHEYYQYLVTDTERNPFSDIETPVRERACTACVEGSEHQTLTEFKQDYYDS